MKLWFRYTNFKANCFNFTHKQLLEGKIFISVLSYRIRVYFCLGIVFNDPTILTNNTNLFQNLQMVCFYKGNAPANIKNAIDYTRNMGLSTTFRSFQVNKIFKFNAGNFKWQTIRLIYGCQNSSTYNRVWLAILRIRQYSRRRCKSGWTLHVKTHHLKV